VIGALIGRLAHPANAKNKRTQSIRQKAHMAFDVSHFINGSFLLGQSSVIIDFITPFLAFNKSRNWGKEFIIS
jgi:hypothetical protein